MNKKLFSISTICGKYITLINIENVLSQLSTKYFDINIKGRSVNNQPLYTVRFGNGNERVILWSHMHGNEPTTTKAVLDWLMYLQTDQDYFNHLCTHFTICVLPMVNPDGAELYTRNNANGVDLNRDSVSLSQPESVFLNEVIKEFSPTLALNLHDQRSIFGAGDSGLPASLSFLSPAYNDEREVNDVRLKGMLLIGAIAKKLQAKLPGKIARFDDSFNRNCIGDYVTSLGIPTILFEAGLVEHDYEREVSRGIILEALFHLFDLLITEEYLSFDKKNYWELPENIKNFNDIKIVDFSYASPELIKNNAIFVQYVEKKQNNMVVFDYSLDFEQSPEAVYAHKILKANGLSFFSLLDIYNFLDENL